MRSEYDLGGSKRNPHAERVGARGREVLVQRFLRSENLVRLDEDVAAAFADEASVNEALRLVLQLREVGAKARPRRAPADASTSDAEPRLADAGQLEPAGQRRRRSPIGWLADRPEAADAILRSGTEGRAADEMREIDGDEDAR
jgi:hypothetical protein